MMKNIVGKVGFSGETIICFAGGDWWYHNPHSDLHLMQSFSKDNRILFVNSIGVRMPNLRTDKFATKRIFNKLKSMLRYLRKGQENIYVLTPFAIPLIDRYKQKIYRWNTRLLVVQIKVLMWILNFRNPILWVTIPSARDIVLYLRKNGAKALVYYNVDNISHYAGVDQGFVDQLDRDIQRHADVAFFVNRDLVEERRSENPRSYHLSHGVDYDHFSKAQGALTTPEDIQNIPRPIVGYMGVIEGVDFGLIRYLAEKNPEKSFVFIGEVLSEADEKMPLNVYFLGRKDYSRLPEYLSEFACCCLYYKTDNQFDNYRNPKKLMEYLATGKPIVAVANLEIRKFRDLIKVADSYESFDRFLNEAISHDPTESRERRLEFARSHTWDRVAADAARLVMEQVAKGPSQ